LQRQAADLVGGARAKLAGFQKLEQIRIQTLNDSEPLGDPALVLFKEPSHPFEGKILTLVEVPGQRRLLIKRECFASGVESEHHRLGLEIVPVPYHGDNGLLPPPTQAGETLESVHDFVESGFCLNDGEWFLQIESVAPSIGACPLQVKQSGLNLPDRYMNDLHNTLP